MKTARFRSVVALGLGCAILLWGLAHLHGIFLEERRSALESIAARHRALSEYAHQEMTARLNRAMTIARGRIDEALGDPLRPTADLLVVDDGVQVMPRMARFAEGAQDLPWRVYRCLERDCDRWTAEAPWPGSGPFQERLANWRKLDAALTAGDAEAIEQRVRDDLRLRSLYVIDARLEVPLTLLLVERLTSRARPERELLRLLLRDGYRGDGARIEGLQRLLLRRRERFTRQSFETFASRIVQQSEPGGVAVADFKQRQSERLERVKMPEAMAEPTLLRDDKSQWFVVPDGRSRVLGARVDLADFTEEITKGMRRRRLITAADHVQLEGSARALGLSKLSFVIESPSWAIARLEAEERYRIKALLELLVALLTFTIVGLSVVLYRRRNRFVALKSEFVSAVSHELRTPLASIRLMAETLERRTRDVPGAKDYPTRIVRDVESLSFLVENILSFDRLDRGRWTPKPRAVAATDLVDKLQQDRDLWANKEAVLRAEGHEELWLNVDPDLVMLMLTNLVRNACQYSSSDPVMIELIFQSDGDRASLRVRDNGSGIAAEDQPHIFDDFFRGQASRSASGRGSGLGLSIGHKIVAAHGGDLVLEHTGADGTTFKMSFAKALRPATEGDEMA